MHWPILAELGIRREVHGSTGYMSVHPKEIHAGLGRQVDAVDVDIIWPNGSKQTVKGLAANQRHRIRATR